MTDTTTTPKEERQPEAPSNQTNGASPRVSDKPVPRARGGRRDGAPSGGSDRRRARRGARGGAERQRSEFDQKVISLRRVARVVAGGRRFSFSAAVVAGDHKGRVGVGLGKGGDTALAMDKAMRDAKKNMIRVSLTDTKSIPHDVHAKYGASVIALKPSPARGIVAGSSVRIVLELAGVADITAKIHSRSKNKLNNARATINALSSLRG